MPPEQKLYLRAGEKKWGQQSIGADADLTEFATNRKKTTAANLDALVYDRWGIHQGVSSTHRNCAFWITQMGEYDHAYVAVSLCWLSKRSQRFKILPNVKTMIGQILSSVTELATPVAITPIFINAFVVNGW